MKNKLAENTTWHGHLHHLLNHKERAHILESEVQRALSSARGLCVTKRSFWFYLNKRVSRGCLGPSRMEENPLAKDGNGNSRNENIFQRREEKQSKEHMKEAEEERQDNGYVLRTQRARTTL